MTNKEKLEIIDRKLNELYEYLSKDVIKDLLLRDYRQLTQTISILENMKASLEPINNYLELNEESQEIIDENLPPFIEETIEEFVDDEFLIEVKPTIYVCPICKKEAFIYGDMIDGKCLKCNQKLVKKED